MGDLVPHLAFAGTSSFALTTLGLLSCCCCCCCSQTPAQDLVIPTEPQKKTEPQLPSKQIWDQKKTNRKHRGGQLFPSLCQTGLRENPSKKVRKTMASDKNGRKTQANSRYLLYLPIWIFFLPVTTSGFLTLQKSLEISNPTPQETKGEMSTLFITVWCKHLIHIPCDTVCSGVNLPVGDATYFWVRI